MSIRKEEGPNRVDIVNSDLKFEIRAATNESKTQIFDVSERKWWSRRVAAAMMLCSCQTFRLKEIAEFDNFFAEKLPEIKERKLA